MSNELFEQGQKLWVHGLDGTQRPAIFVGSDEGMSFLGAPPRAYVLLEDTREPAEVEIDRLTVRE